MKKFKEMDCPICGKFSFINLRKEDEEIHGSKFEQQCPSCGWKYDLKQTRDPDLPNGNNLLSLNAYKKEYQKKIEENPKYDFFDEHYVPTPHLCPVCGKYKFKDRNTYDFCPVCGWCDDELMEDEPNKWAGCGNDLCLNDYKEQYYEYLKHNPNYKFKKDGFF